MKSFIAIILLLIPVFVSSAEWIPKREWQFQAPPQYRSMVYEYATKNQIPMDIAVAMIFFESQWNPRARSKKNSIGLTQLNRQYHDWFQWKFNDGRCFSEYNPRDSIKIGFAYLSWLHLYFGTWRLAIMAYNAGPNFFSFYGFWPEESINLALNVLEEK